MKRSELTELHYITPIDNLPSILQHGILSHRKAARLRHASIAMRGIQQRRKNKQVPSGQRLHEYANLYICARNAMLSKRRAENNTICALRISTDVLDIPGTIISDSNASSDYARFAAAPSGLKIVDRQLTFAADWRDGDRIQYFRKKQRSVPKCLFLILFLPGISMGLMLQTS